MRWALAILASGVLVAAANIGSAAAAGPSLIYKVDSAAITVKGNRMTIIASGAVTSGGWGNARLRMKPGQKPHTDAPEFEFTATPPPPGEAVIQALMPMTATLTIRLPPSGPTPVRIDAQTNSTIASPEH